MVEFKNSMLSFCGAPLAPALPRGDLLATESIESRKKGKAKRVIRYEARTKRFMFKGELVSPDFYSRLTGTLAPVTDPSGPREELADEGPVWKVADVTGAAAVTVEFKKRPFGIEQYNSDEEGKGARVVTVGKPFYTGDPSGQAKKFGVKEGYVVKSIDGKDVTDAPFNQIMDILGDPAVGGNGAHKAYKVPMTVVFSTLK